MNTMRKIVLAIACISSSLVAQEEPKGKISGLMFGDYFYNIARDSAVANGSLSNVATGGAK